MQITVIHLSQAEAESAALVANIATHFGAEIVPGVLSTTINSNDVPDLGRAPSLSLPNGAINPTADLTKVFVGDGPLAQPALGVAAVGQLPIAPVGSLALPASTLPVPPAGSTGPVPTAPAAPSTAVGGVELDSDGLPWDVRIHAGSKTKTKAGAWVAKRGINDASLVKRVEGDLRAALGAGAPPTAAAAPAAAPVAPLLPPPPVPPEGETFQSIMMRLAPHMQSGLLTAERQAAVLAEFGGLTLPTLPTRPDLLPAVGKRFDECIAYWMAGNP